MDETETVADHEPLKKKQPLTVWNVRESLGSVAAMRRYDEYVKEHRRRLRQLEKEARGEMSPSGDWYREA